MHKTAKYFICVLIVIFSLLLVPLLLVPLLLVPLTAVAKEFHDVKMADDLMIGNQKLFLKGMGLRELTFLGIIIRVYVGGLYVSDLKEDCDKVIQSDKTRAVYMTFLRHASPSDLSKNLEEGVERNCGNNCKELKPKAKEIKPLIPGVSSGDTLKISFDSKGTAFQLNDKALGRVEGVEFSRTLLSAFIGEHPATEDLKSGLCGKN